MSLVRLKGHAHLSHALPGFCLRLQLLHALHSSLVYIRALLMRCNSLHSPLSGVPTLDLGGPAGSRAQYKYCIRRYVKIANTFA